MGEPGVKGMEADTVLSVCVAGLETSVHELRLDMRSLRDKVGGLSKEVRDSELAVRAT